MRKIAARIRLGFLLLFTLLLLTACTPRWGMFRGSDQKDSIGPASREVPTAAQLVSYLDENSSRLHCISCPDLHLTAAQGIKAFGLRGQMVCQQPRCFRMNASILGKEEVDLGSNQEEFWYWVRMGDPYQIHCSYKDMEEGRVKRMPFPFQPDWIMDALGMGHYGPPERYQLVEKPETLELIEKVRSPQGIPVRKVIVVRRRPVLLPKGTNLCPPQVMAFLLLDDRTGKEICSAHIEQAQLIPSANDPANKGAMLPREMVLRWPDAPGGKISLTMRLDTVTAKTDYPPNFPAFVRRPLQGVPGFDLASGRVDGQPSSLQRAGFSRLGGR